MRYLRLFTTLGLVFFSTLGRLRFRDARVTICSSITATEVDGEAEYPLKGQNHSIFSPAYSLYYWKVFSLWRALP